MLRLCPARSVQTRIERALDAIQPSVTWVLDEKLLNEEKKRPTVAYWRETQVKPELARQRAVPPFMMPHIDAYPQNPLQAFSVFALSIDWLSSHQVCGMRIAIWLEEC